jgi:hypothetical protein
VEVSEFLKLVQAASQYGLPFLAVSTIVAIVVIWRRHIKIQDKLEESYEKRTAEQSKASEVNKEVFDALLNNAMVIAQFRELEERRYIEVKQFFLNTQKDLENIDDHFDKGKEVNQTYFNEMRVWREALSGKANDIINKTDELKNLLREVEKFIEDSRRRPK